MMSNDTKINHRCMTRRKISSTSLARSPRVPDDRKKVISEVQGPRLCRRLASDIALMVVHWSVITTLVNGDYPRACSIESVMESPREPFRTSTMYEPVHCPSASRVHCKARRSQSRAPQDRNVY